MVVDVTCTTSFSQNPEVEGQEGREEGRPVCEVTTSRRVCVEHSCIVIGPRAKYVDALSWSPPKLNLSLVQ